MVLDTHAWIWWAAEPSKLSPSARERIERALEQDGLVISTMSTWEVSMLVVRKRLELSISLDVWISNSERARGVRFEAPGNAIMSDSVTLPGRFRPDPADRIIVATARVLDMPLITADEKIRAYPHVETVW